MRNAHLSLLNNLKYFNCGRVRKFALHYHWDNIFITLGSKLYRPIVGIPMGTNCAPVATASSLIAKRWPGLRFNDGPDVKLL